MRSWIINTLSCIFPHYLSWDQFLCPIYPFFYWCRTWGYAIFLWCIWGPKQLPQIVAEYTQCSYHLYLYTWEWWTFGWWWRHLRLLLVVISPGILPSYQMNPQNLLSKIYNINCLLKIVVNYLMNPPNLLSKIFNSICQLKIIVNYQMNQNTHLVK